MLIKSRIQQGPFDSVFNLIERIPLNTKDIEALLLSGSCDSLAPLTEESYPFNHQHLLEYLKEEFTGKHRSYVPPKVIPKDSKDIDRFEQYRKLTRLKNELYYLEMHLTDHPIALLRAESKRYDCRTAQEVMQSSGKQVSILAIVAANRRVKVRSEKIMQYVTLEDEFGLLKSIVGPGVFEKLVDPIKNPGPFLLRGKYVESGIQSHLFIDDVRPFHQRSDPYGH